VAHLDPETLVLLALGEDGSHADHLDTCDTCRAEVAALRRVAELGAETQEVRELHQPPDAVWDRIAAATNVGSTAEGPVRPARRRRIGGRTASPGRSDRTTGPAAGSGPGRTRRWALIAATAVVALVAGVGGTLWATRDRVAPDSRACGTVVARADLAALPLAPSGATGEARVLCDGPDRRLHLHVAGLPLQPGYYEVWLIDPDTMEMTAIGVLGDGGDVLLPLASTTDLRKYRLVDISAEQYDNNQAHSGESLLRGQLTT
jgi:anti-sigma-K factor RskA